ncbi:MAG: F0F1 ATP synthase subunit B [Clostridia bacterium]
MFNLTSILLHVVNAVILFVALYFLLVKPVRKFMQKRTDGIAAQLQSAADAQTQVEEQRKAMNDELAQAKKTAAETIQKSVSQAQDQAEQVLREAQSDAEQRIAHTRTECEHMRQSAQETMRGEVAGLGVALASKILQREINEADHRKLVDDFIEKVG